MKKREVHSGPGELMHSPAAEYLFVALQVRGPRPGSMLKHNGTVCCVRGSLLLRPPIFVRNCRNSAPGYRYELPVHPEGLLRSLRHTHKVERPDFSVMTIPWIHRNR